MFWFRGMRRRDGGGGHSTRDIEGGTGVKNSTHWAIVASFTTRIEHGPQYSTKTLESPAHVETKRGPSERASNRQTETTSAHGHCRALFLRLWVPPPIVTPLYSRSFSSSLPPSGLSPSSLLVPPHSSLCPPLIRMKGAHRRMHERM
jgi:hypothetical protein